MDYKFKLIIQTVNFFYKRKYYENKIKNNARQIKYQVDPLADLD